MYEFGGLTKGADKTKVLIVAVAVLAIIAAMGLGLALWQKKESPAAQAASAKKDDAATSARIIKKVGDLYDVPVGEEPTVAAIQDRSKLDGQEFFNKAQNGDYLLVYTKAKLALLYREATDKLINVGPINMQENGDAASGATSGQ